MIPQDKAGIHALLKQMELAREDEVKRATAELEGVRKDLSRKENEWAEARREATSERTRADTERESGEIKVKHPTECCPVQIGGRRELVARRIGVALPHADVEVPLP